MTNVIAGSTVSLQHKFTLDVAAVPTGVTLQQGRPDGSVVTISATVPGTSSAVPIATALVPFVGPGVYSLLWSLQTADGQTVVEQDDYFAPNTAVHRFVRERLSATVDTLPDAPLDSTLCFVSRLVVRRLDNVLASYQAVPIVDMSLFDQALALVAAAYLRPLVPKTVASGEMTGVQIGTDKFTYSNLADRANKPADPVEQQWIDQAGELVLSCSFVAIDDDALTNMPLFQVNGPRRAARTALGFSEATTPIYQLWGDIATRWAWERNNIYNWVQTP